MNIKSSAVLNIFVLFVTTKSSYSLEPNITKTSRNSIEIASWQEKLSCHASDFECSVPTLKCTDGDCQVRCTVTKDENNVLKLTFDDRRVPSVGSIGKGRDYFCVKEEYLDGT